MGRNAVFIVIIVVCIVLSAFFSATETAYNALNRVRVKNMAEKGNKKADLVLRLLDQYDYLLSSILIGNNIVNILATSLATVIFVRALGEDLGSGISTLVITLVLLVFGEISPKSMAKVYPEKFAMFAGPFMQGLVVVLAPLNWIFQKWKNLIAKLFHGEEDRGITEEELLTIVDEAADEGGLDEEESELIRNSIEFSEQSVEDILTPRVDVIGVEDTLTKDEIAAVFRETNFSRLPVYHEDLDHITGILNQKDFYNIAVGTDVEAAQLIRPVLYVPGNMKIDDLLKELQKKKMHMAVVLDEYGGTTGIVTMEDILEELVGEIWDEHDEVVQEITEVSETEILALGSANLDKLMELLDHREEWESTTVSGWVFELAGKIPTAGESFDHENLKVIVLEMDGNRVERVKIQRTPQESESSEQ